MTASSHVPERTCIGCRAKAPRSQLLRLALTASGELAVDARALMPGRGAWIHVDPACLDLAERRRALGRALRAEGPLDAAPARDWLAAHAAPSGAQDPTGPCRGRNTDNEGG
ncbi:YlxR family protein [Actinomyces timonensis]|uniref:YlxR family protein n=1 Tax=Actinomyces timonensis TaxID=1288391 RepID=A0AAU8N709_9ACTO